MDGVTEKCDFRKGVCVRVWIKIINANHQKSNVHCKRYGVSDLIATGICAIHHVVVPRLWLYDFHAKQSTKTNDFPSDFPPNQKPFMENINRTQLINWSTLVLRHFTQDVFSAAMIMMCFFSRSLKSNSVFQFQKKTCKTAQHILDSLFIIKEVISKRTGTPTLRDCRWACVRVYSENVADSSRFSVHKKHTGDICNSCRSI